MAINLILWGINEVHQGLHGLVHKLLDSLGALDKVENLPPYRIPTQCSHSDILKNKMVNSSNLSFVRIFSHVKSHQNGHTGYESHTHSAQLNCQMDYHAKNTIWDMDYNPGAPTKRFPLEPLCVFLGKNKLHRTRERSSASGCKRR